MYDRSRVAAVSLKFAYGTLEVVGYEGDAEALPPDFIQDKRTASFRAPAYRYAEVVLALRDAGVEFEDEARGYTELATQAKVSQEPRDFQSEALAAWRKARGQGVVVLPTGAGKTYLAIMAIADRGRSALVVVPTLDLVRQWYDRLRRTFRTEVGIVGGGEHRVEPLTVTTYDSAYLHMEHFGNRFGLIVFDECHHLPSEAYEISAKQCLAPFRLGLTATPERADGKESVLAGLIGETVYRKDITELSGSYLADYEVRTLKVHLSDAEREEYDRERAVYTGFLRKQGIRMSSPRGWSDFIMRSSISREGREAMASYRRQKELALCASGKMELLEGLLQDHNRDRTLIFTQDNATAYGISRRFLIPTITHQTKVSERSEILQRLASGEYNAVVTSKVLNEGVDVPEANVAVIMSGSGSVREHVQRLGRILRKQEGKRATLYEVISAGTSESSTSSRRRDHSAYR